MQQVPEQHLLDPPLLFCLWSVEGKKKERKTLDFVVYYLKRMWRLHRFFFFFEVSKGFWSNKTCKGDSPWELGSGRLSRGTKCITVVLPSGNPSAPNVTLQCKNLPWYISLKISAFATASDSQSNKKETKSVKLVRHVKPKRNQLYQSQGPNTFSITHFPYFRIIHCV